MENNNKGYRVVPFPAARQLVIDAGYLGARRHIIHGLAEFDVSRVREFIREHKERTGETLSFTAYLVSCLAQAIAANPQVQASRNWRNQLIVYDDVDVMIPIEATADTVAMLHVVRAANRKSFREISDEIRAVQAQPAKSEQHPSLLKLGTYLPRFMRFIFLDALRMNPHWQKQYGGTVILTAVGMFVGGGGWGFGFLPMHTLGLTIGGIAEKPAIVDGQLVSREYLCVTISLDHDIVDGAPAARFGKCFKELVESGYGLCEEHHQASEAAYVSH